jgi:GDP-mannose 6-dehydrogenase
MRLNIFGLGYVGSVTSVCLASIGHDVLGVEVVEEKAKALNEGRLPLFEPSLGDLYKAVFTGEDGSFRAVTELPSATAAPADASIVCVGTPSSAGGEVDLSQLIETSKAIGKYLRGATHMHHVIFRSTVPPGTTEEVLIPLLEAESGKKRGKDFHACFYPEFLREGQAVRDFFNPSMNLVGALDEASVPLIEAIFKVDKKAAATDVRVAEMIKYANNSFHALKVAFANEMGTLASAYGVDSQELMRLFASDTQLNLSPYYLRPGFAFGGSCLPKELRSVSALAIRKNIRVPLLESIMLSNEEHIRRVISLIQAQATDKAKTRVGFFGASFKPNTDDTRESPVVKVIERLISGPSYREPVGISAYVHESVGRKLRGMFGDRVELASSPDDLLRTAHIVVLGPKKLDDETHERLARFPGPVIDLKWHDVPESVRTNPLYREIC